MKRFLLILAVIGIPISAQARECVRYSWVEHRRSCNVSEGFFGSCPRGHWRRVCVRWSYYDDETNYRRYDPRPEDAARVYGYERREQVQQHGRCLDGPRLSVTDSIDHLGIDKAKQSAQDAWSNTVENRYGTRWASIKNAEERTYECVEKVPQSTSQRLQADIGVRHYICTVEALPCRAAKEYVEFNEELAKRPIERRIEEYRPEAPPKKRWWRRRYE